MPKPIWGSIFGFDPSPLKMPLLEQEPTTEPNDDMWHDNQ